MFVENITNVKGEDEFTFPSGTEFFIDSIEFHLKFIDDTDGTTLIDDVTLINITIPLY